MTRDDATPPPAEPDATASEPAGDPGAQAPAAVTEAPAETLADPLADPLADLGAEAEPAAPSTPAAPRSIVAGGVVAPSLEDPVAASASAIAGGPAGRHLASARTLFGAASVLVLLAACFMGLGVVQKQHCRHMGWNSPDFFWHACYSDIPIGFQNAGLEGDPVPALKPTVTALDGPPLASVAMWAVAKVTPHSATDDQVTIRRYFDASAIALTLALLAGVAALAMSGPASGGRRPWDAAHLALSPVLITSALINYELLAVALLAVAMALWSRKKPLLAGVLLGLAAATHIVAFVVAIAAIAVSVSARRWWDTLKLIVSSSVVLMALRIVLLDDNTGNLKQAWTDWKTSDVQFGSLWLVPSLIHDAKPNAGGIWKHFHAMSTTHASQLSIALALFGVAAMIALGLSTHHRPTLGQMALIGVGFFLLSSKNIAPQATLILLPLIAAAGLKWRDHLIWAGSEVIYYVMVWMYIGAQSDSAKGLPPSFYLIFLLLRICTIAWLMIAAVGRARIDSPACRPADDDEPDAVQAPAGDAAPEVSTPAGLKPEAEVITV